MSKIAVFGGTFNPFHIGHYEILKYLCEHPDIDKVLVIPDNIPHKECEFLASDRDRINMCSIVCLDFDKAEVCTVELEKADKSYTFDTLAELKTLYPKDNFIYVCGGDMLAILNNWYKFDELKNITEFMVFSRGNDKNFKQNIEKMRSYGARITVADIKITDISSSKLRNQLKPEYFTKNIYEYLKQRNIYNGQ